MGRRHLTRLTRLTREGERLLAERLGVADVADHDIAKRHLLARLDRLGVLDVRDRLAAPLDVGQRVRERDC